MSMHTVASIFLIASLFLFSCQGAYSHDTSQSEAFAQNISFPGIEKVVPPEFLDKCTQSTGKVKVIVLLGGYKDFTGQTKTDDADSMKAFRSTIRSRQDRVLNALDGKHFQLRYRFENILGFSGEATLQGIKDLAAMENVELIEEDKEVLMNTHKGTSQNGPEEK